MTTEHRDTGTGWPDPETAAPTEPTTPEVAGPGSVALPTADASPPPRRPKPNGAGREAARESAPPRESEPTPTPPTNRRWPRPARCPTRTAPRAPTTPRRPTPATAGAPAASSAPPRWSSPPCSRCSASRSSPSCAATRSTPTWPPCARTTWSGLQSDLTAQEERLQNDITDLEESQRQLQSGAQGRAAALAEAQRRADELEILAGTVPARGPGLVIRMIDGPDGIKASDVLNAVQELRGADAEAMQIAGANGAAERIVASTSFVDSDDGIVVSGQQLTGPYTITVIGDPPTMRTALNIPDGLVPSIRGDGGNVIVDEREVVDVTAIAQPVQLEHARPVS